MQIRIDWERALVDQLKRNGAHNVPVHPIGVHVIRSAR